ncbi:hypothetical protein [Candidatus Nitrososphaera evergladensis]|nr:hypothetical protein [Candidatus Nitrososphaera evergladensis]
MAPVYSAYRVVPTLYLKRSSGVFKAEKASRIIAADLILLLTF